MPKEKTSTEKKSQKGRTVKDKWRLKSWYKVRAPTIFQSVEIGETPAEEPEKVIGRIMEVTFNEVSGSGDPGSAHVKLRFKITGIGENHVATTRFVGHEFTSDYIRRLARRKKSKIDASHSVTSKDGVVFVLKSVAVSEHHLQTRLRALLRQKLFQLLTEEAAKRSAAELVKEMLNGEVNKIVAKGLSPLYPLKKIDIRASIVEGEIPEIIEPKEVPPATSPEEPQTIPETIAPQADT